MVCSEFRNLVVCSELTFAAELCSAANLGFAPKLNCLQPLNIHCRIVSCSKFRVRCLSCMVRIKFEIHCRNWVVCNELTFTAKLCVLQRNWDSLSKLNCLQWIWNSLPKLSCLRWINIRCRIVCPSANLVFAAEIELFAAINICCWIVFPAANYHSLPKCVSDSEFEVRRRSCVVCNDNCCRNWVVCNELYSSLSKLSCLQWINIRCWIVCWLVRKSAFLSRFYIIILHLKYQ